MEDTSSAFDKALFVLSDIWQKNYRIAPTDPTPYFTITSLDKKVLYDLYPEQFPPNVAELLKNLSTEDFNGLNSLNCELHVSSALFNQLPSVREYQTTYDKFFPKQVKANQEKLDQAKTKQEKLEQKNIIQEGYNKEIKILREKISGNIKSEFYQILSTHPKSSKLLDHSETLFFICIYFYNTLWDPWGLTFNGSVAINNSINDLEFEEEPFDYRMTKIQNFFGEFLFDYYKTKELPKEIDILFRGKNHVATDPLILKWVFETLITGFKTNTFTAELYLFGRDISNLILAKDQLSNDAFLDRLKYYKNLEALDFVNVKRKVVGEFCLYINTAFSYYLGFSGDVGDVKSRRIYINILKLFQMDDFSQNLRDSNSNKSSSKQPRADSAENNLSNLMKRTLIAKQVHQFASKD
jgi:hypothetical protein